MKDMTCPIYIVDIKDMVDAITRSDITTRYPIDRVITVTTRLAYTLYRWKDAPIETTADTAVCIKGMLTDDYVEISDIVKEDEGDAKLIMSKLLPILKNVVSNSLGDLPKEYLIKTVKVDVAKRVLLLSVTNRLTWSESYEFRDRGDRTYSWLVEAV